MARETTWVLALLMACAPAVGIAAPTGQQGRPPAAQGTAKDGKDKSPEKPDERERWKWWLYDRAELGISESQSNEINSIFESTLQKLRETRQELDRAEEEMARIIKEHKAALSAVASHVDRLETARAQHNKTRTLMLYRMHLLLSAEQRTKLEALRARRDAARKDGPRRHP